MNAVDTDPALIAEAVQVIEACTDLCCAAERAVMAGESSTVKRLLDRRQQLLERLVDLVRQGVRTDQEEIRSAWLCFVVQDKVVQDSLARALSGLKKKLSKVRQSLNTTSAYGELAPRARASMVDLRG